MVLFRQSQLHAIEIIHQVYRRRARGPQRFQCLGQFIPAEAAPGQKRQQQAGRQAD